MIVRTGQHAAPAPRETHWEQHQAHIDTWFELVASVQSTLRDLTVLQPGEILLLDNYRCLHGVAAHDGARTVHILPCISTDAR